MRIAFYAPMKAPDHPVPSGDREMARLLVRAIRHAGHACDVVSRLRTYAHAPDPEALAGLEASARSERDALLSCWRDDAATAPDVWFTYHPYYKAPDLVGPRVAAALGIPYATAEASHAGKRDRDGWRAWQAPVIEGLRQGAVHFCLTPVDRAGLAGLLGSDGRLVHLPPFVDSSPFAPVERTARRDAVELVAVAMMRPGKKVRSYRFLAEALRGLGEVAWRLTIVGDGEARAAVEAAFDSTAPGQVRWRGEVARNDLPSVLAAADVFVWPGFEEDYGMVYLEAQASGLPVVALASDGVRQVMRAGETGILVESEGTTVFAQAILGLALDHERRVEMGTAARRFALQERSLAQAAAILDRGLEAAVKCSGGPRKAPHRHPTCGAESPSAHLSPADLWHRLEEELDRWAAAGRTARLWLRDDDAIEPTPALDRLLDLAAHHDVPILLAVIPLAATAGLADRIGAALAVSPCQHGAGHRNHAGPAEKKQELGIHRPLEVIVEELVAARDRLAELFGAKVAPILVPPWNRIAPEVARELPRLGFAALSSFGSPMAAGPVRRVDCDIDIIDWKGGRRGRDPGPLLAAVIESLARARTGDDRPLGVLTHHLVHDEVAWSFLDALMAHTARHPAAQWMGWADLLGTEPERVRQG